MKKGRITAACFCCDGVDVDALISDSGYLAVHRGIRFQRGGADWWVVTHIPTGLAVQSIIFKRREAMTLAIAIDGLDWNFRSPRSRKIRDLKYPIEQAVSEAMGYA